MLDNYNIDVVVCLLFFGQCFTHPGLGWIMRVRGSGDVSADTQTGDASDVTASLLNVVAALTAATVLVMMQSGRD